MILSKAITDILSDVHSLEERLVPIRQTLREAERAFDEPPLTAERLAQLETAIHTLGGPNRHHEVPGTLLLALIAAAKEGVRE